MFSVSKDDVYVLKPISKNININYIYYYIKINIELIINSFKGSTIKHSSKSELEKIKIKIPKNKNLISDLEPTFQEVERLQNEIKDAETLFNKYIKELGEEAIKTN